MPGNSHQNMIGHALNLKALKKKNHVYFKRADDAGFEMSTSGNFSEHFNDCIRSGLFRNRNRFGNGTRYHPPAWGWCLAGRGNGRRSKVLFYFASILKYPGWP